MYCVSSSVDLHQNGNETTAEGKAVAPLRDVYCMWGRGGTKALEAKEMTDIGVTVTNINMMEAI